MKKLLRTITGLVTIIGALNWGLVGALDMNLVTRLLGTAPNVVKVAYIVVGISGLIYAGIELSDNRLF